MVSSITFQVNQWLTYIIQYFEHIMSRYMLGSKQVKCVIDVLRCKVSHGFIYH